jgi:peptidoglycan LD-endopeptidase CwlK
MASTATLDERFRPYADWLLAIATEYLDPSFRVTSARRDTAEQARLYERFRLGLSNLPAAAPGTSWHEYGLAVDIARPGIDPREDDLLQELGQFWVKVGGFWSARDPVHFQPPKPT